MMPSSRRIRHCEQDRDGDDEAANDDCHGLSLEAYLNDCPPFAVESDRAEIVEQGDW